jgi:hypothetical protein
MRILSSFLFNCFLRLQINPLFLHSITEKAAVAAERIATVAGKSGLAPFNALIPILQANKEEVAVPMNNPKERLLLSTPLATNWPAMKNKAPNPNPAAKLILEPRLAYPKYPPVALIQAIEL